MQMNRKSKGINAERELIHLFWNTDSWSAIRAAGSGCSRYPSPDVLAGNSLRKLAIECKSSKEDNIYLEKKEINELKEFGRRFGAEPWIGIRINLKEWFFLTLEDIKETENGYSVSVVLAKRKGLLFEELIR